MGGYGSGRWYRWNKQTTIEEVRRIDIRYLKKRGWLIDKPGNFMSCTLSWTCQGEPNGFINVQFHFDRLELDYRFREGDGDWVPIKQTILLENTPCHYGGSRKWFTCPECHNRVGILCGAGQLFLCRHCYQLPYGSQMESGLDRLISKKHKLGNKIFEDYDGSGWRKRKGMQCNTFDRLYACYAELEDQIDTSLYNQFLSLS